MVVVYNFLFSVVIMQLFSFLLHDLSRNIDIFQPLKADETNNVIRLPVLDSSTQPKSMVSSRKQPAT